jgi:hypothetical protein
MLPEGAVYSRLAFLSRWTADACRRDLFRVYVCDANEKYHHFIEHADAMFDEVRLTSDPVTTTDDRTLLTHEVPASVTSQLWYWYLGVFEQNTLDATPFPLYAAAWNHGQCSDCPVGPLGVHYQGYVGGDDATALQGAEFAYSSDRFATLTAPTTGFSTADYVVSSIFANGDFVLVATVDTIDPTTATAGEIEVSSDGGVNFDQATFDGGATPALFDIAYGDGYYYAVGSAGEIWRSPNGFSWTQVVTTTITGTDDLYSIDYEPTARVFYAVGHDGTNGLMVRIDDLIVSDISASITALVTTNILHRVRVLGADHVMVGGAGGTLIENSGVLNGNSWYAVPVAGFSGTIYAFDGVPYRVVIGFGSDIYIRDLMTNMRFVKRDPVPGITVSGNYRDIVVGDTSVDVDNFLCVTDTSEVVILRNFSPDG